MNTTFNVETRILHILLQKSYEFPNPGLLSGKMGISLFFMHYFTKTKQSIFKDYAFDLVNKITDEFNYYTPLGFDSGLSGIGWGIEYLLKNQFAEGEGVDICEAIDNRIMQKDPRRIDDLSLETGLEGLLHYVLAHIQGAIIKRTNLPFAPNNFDDLYTAVCSIPSHTLNNRMNRLVKSYKDFYERKEGIHYDVNITTFIEKIKVEEDNIVSLPLGLKNGLAGYMLSSLLLQ